MSYPLFTVFGAMLINENFHRSMMRGRKEGDAALKAALRKHVIGMSTREFEILKRMLDSFERGAMDEPINRIRAECPVWPCPEPPEPLE
jgi:hypothetical protein